MKFKDLYTMPPKGSRRRPSRIGRVWVRLQRCHAQDEEEDRREKSLNESRQGLKEFVSEIVSIGRMSHRNLVPLLGYCRRKNELLLVYDYMPNGSLDKYLYNSPEVTSTGNRGLKSSKVWPLLFFLHEEWEQVVIHRDIKASNVLLDAELNGRLGDFGLARLCGHGRIL
ncbi:unnamed protein product [Microthlaspi erraticum]|uniref:Protein kinase domain-containing protein n=1 Tax=Microthlaspi erraticum TaxID=1685480 RepID=A0A6D2JQ99_9BRAS|nr:unnamed protein product [Microthlaspi erraticum]